MKKVIVFDFDDTLVKSESIKQQAFEEIFSCVTGAAEIAKNFVTANPLLPRRSMIQGILLRLQQAGLIECPDLDSVTEEYVTKFTREVEEAVPKAEEVLGATPILEYLSQLYPLYLNSATPQETLARIIQGKHWQKFFKGLYGSPPGSKIEHLREIISKEKAMPQDVIVVGDGISDLEAAKNCGAQFINVKSISNLMVLAKLLKEI